MAGVVVDTFLVFEFIKRLTTPFEKWKAFELGVIDEDGNILKKRRERKTTDEKDSLRLFDLTMLNLKRLLEKLPGGKSKIASYAAALFLVKESENMHNGYYLTEDEHPTDDLEKRFKQYMEDIANTASSGNVAGIDGDPPGPSPLGKKKKKKKLSTIVSR